MPILDVCGGEQEQAEQLKKTFHRNATKDHFRHAQLVVRIESLETDRIGAVLQHTVTYMNKT